MQAGSGFPVPRSASSASIPWALSAAAGTLALAGGLLVTLPARAQDDPRIELLQRQIEDLQRQLNELKGDVESRMPPPPERAPGAPLPVVSGGDKIKLAISGQVNRAMNVGDDGKRTKVYFVDNDASNTRLRAIGTGQVSDDLTIGARLEVAFAPNESSQVNQENEDSGNFIDERWADVWAESERFGKLSLGKGDTASNNSAEVDLSSTDVVMYSSVADIAGGLLFRQKDGNLSDVQVNQAFNDFDGLSRQNRTRYDTPRYAGFALASSVSSNQRYDGAVTWAGEGYGVQAAAATAIADPNLDNVDYRLDGSFSVLHETTGLNLTVSSGMNAVSDGGNQSNFYVKGGWIANFFDFGPSAFGVDYAISTNNPTSGDQGFSVGGALVQHIANFGTELYSQVRVYSLDRDGAPDVDDIVVGTVGTRVKF